MITPYLNKTGGNGQYQLPSPSIRDSVARNLITNDDPSFK